MADLVSILIPVYNCERWIGSAIESALAQTWANTEIIAIDDASTDGSWEALQKWGNRIRLEKAGRNGGQNVTRNYLTRLSKGDWLVYLDADDELAPDAVAHKLRLAAQADAVYGSMEVRFYDGTQVSERGMVRAETFPDPFVAAFWWQYPNTSSLLFRRSALLDAGGWNEGIQNCTDYDLYFRMLLAGRKFVPAPESLTVYRQWRRSQAAHENPGRVSTTRLDTTWRAVLELERRNQLSPQAREAFCNATLGVIRTLFRTDRTRSRREHDRLQSWDRKFVPTARIFSKGYRAAYRIAGFRAAELFARATRFFRRPGPPAPAFRSDENS